MKQRFNDRNDVYEYWGNVENMAAIECWKEFMSKRKESKYGGQTWVVMDSLKFVPLVRRAYANELTGTDIDLIEEYAELIFFNYCKLNFNTIMVGHTPHEPYHELIQYSLIPEELSKKRMKRWCHRYCEWVHDGAFSDYGLKPIAELLMPMMLQKNYSLKVQIMADIIGITHCRSDLASFFVEEGKITYAKTQEIYEHEYDSVGY